MGTYNGVVSSSVEAGKVVHRIKFECVHENVEITKSTLFNVDHVFCHDCDNEDMSDEQATSLLISYEDARAAQEEDRGQQDE